MDIINTTMTTAFEMSPSLWAVFDSVAVFRLTRLVTRDLITERARQWVLRHWGMAAFDFVVCPWCVSIWLAGGVVAATVFVPNQWKFAAYILTCSAIAGLLVDR